MYISRDCVFVCICSKSTTSAQHYTIFALNHRRLPSTTHVDRKKSLHRVYFLKLYAGHRTEFATERY